MWIRLLLLFSLNTASEGEVVLASHSLTVPSAEQERRRWCALLYTRPHTESVCPLSSPRSTDGSEHTGTTVTLHAFQLKITPGSIETRAEVTVGVVGVDVRVGRVPTLDGAVDPSAETLFPCTAHHHTQYSAPVVFYIIK